MRITTATSGWDSRIRRVAAIPSSSGISRSMRTTSGSLLPAQRRPPRPVRRRADELDVLERREAAARAPCGRRRGRRRSAAGSRRRHLEREPAFPSPGADRSSTRPPRRAARSSTSVRPTWPSARRFSRSPARRRRRRRRPSSARRRRRARRRRPRSRRARGAATLRSASCGAAEQQQLACSASRSQVVVDVEPRVDAARGDAREQVSERRAETGRAEVRRVDLDEERAQLADGRGRVSPPRRGRRSRRRARSPRGAPSAAAVNAVRRGRRGPGRRRRGGRRRCGGARRPTTPPRARGALALELAPTQPPGEAPRERDLDEPEQEHAASTGTANGRHTAAPPARPSAEALVGLEQERRPVGRANARVDLVQLRPGRARSGSRAARGR